MNLNASSLSFLTPTVFLASDAIILIGSLPIMSKMAFIATPRNIASDLKVLAFLPLKISSITTKSGLLFLIISFTEISNACSRSPYGLRGLGSISPHIFFNNMPSSRIEYPVLIEDTSNPRTFIK